MCFCKAISHGFSNNLAGKMICQTLYDSKIVTNPRLDELAGASMSIKLLFSPKDL